MTAYRLIQLLSLHYLQSIPRRVGIHLLIKHFFGFPKLPRGHVKVNYHIETLIYLLTFLPHIVYLLTSRHQIRPGAVSRPEKPIYHNTFASKYLFQTFD
jgi:hypothetical protein